MRIFNSLKKEREEFKPLKEGKVSMYVCGPTVYDKGHLGHARSAVAFDVARRYLIYKGYDVRFVSNYTDIDDKMIKRAEEEGISVPELAERIIPEYEKDYGKLGILKSDESPKATSFMNEIINSIEALEKKGFVYVIDGDGVYFEVSKFGEYGKLSNQDLEQLESGVRVEINSKKRSPLDFALWKFKKEGEPFWASPWGEGRPGWHIECSAMVKAILGDTIDIHGGGVDLKFPHHECELAQHEAGTGNQFARYWMHNGFVRIDSEKMSKSLNNFFTIEDILAEFDPMVVRLFLIQTHYRSPIDFTKEGLEQAGSAWKRIEAFLGKLKNSDLDETVDEAIEVILKAAKEKMEEGMDDDFGTPKALAALFEMIKALNSIMAKRNLTFREVEAIRLLLAEFDAVLGVVPLRREEEEHDAAVWALAFARLDARQRKDWAEADRLRDQLMNEFGFSITDTGDTFEIRKVK